MYVWECVPVSVLITCSLACIPSGTHDPTVDKLNPLNSGGPDSKAMTCHGTLSSYCKGSACTVSCSDGTEVTLECKSELVNTSQTGASVRYKCGEKPPPCFPFC